MFFFGGVIYLLLEISVISRIINLRKGIQSIGKDGSSNLRIHEKGSDEIKYLADSLNSLLDTISERNSTIQNIFDNISFGLFIADGNMRVTPGISKSCENLFAQAKVEGRTLPELLGMAAAEASWYETIYQQIFADIMPVEVSLAQLPHSFKVYDRFVHLEGKPHYDTDKNILAILFSVADVTDLANSERENLENQTLLKILKAKQIFIDFIQETKSHIEAIRTSIRNDNLTAARRPLHTLKGNYSFYNLTEIVDTIHNIEERVHFTQDEIDCIEVLTRKYLEGNREILQISYDEKNEESFMMGESKLLKLESLVRKFVSKDSDEILLELQLLRMKPIGEMLGSVEDTVQRIAKRLHKSVEVKLEGLHVLVKPAAVRPLLDVLPHLLRNSLDHGLEEMGARMDKPEVGTIRIHFEVCGDTFYAFVEDDGRGLDRGRLRDRAVTLGHFSALEAEKTSNETIEGLIFFDNLSTASQVSDISGRGIGMSAVKESIELAGGHINLVNRPGLGLKIEFYLPMKAITPITHEWKKVVGN